MHRKQESNMSTLDTELERTIRGLRKTKRDEKATLADERINQTVEQERAAQRLQKQDTMEDSGDLSSKQNTQPLDDLL